MQVVADAAAAAVGALAASTLLLESSAEFTLESSSSPFLTARRVLAQYRTPNFYPLAVARCWTTWTGMWTAPMPLWVWQKQSCPLAMQARPNEERQAPTDGQASPIVALIQNGQPEFKRRRRRGTCLRDDSNRFRAAFYQYGVIQTFNSGGPFVDSETPKCELRELSTDEAQMYITKVDQPQADLSRTSKS